MACGCVDKLFDDKRLAVCILMMWLVIVVALFKDIGLLDTKFMTMGPSTTAVFMGITLDTWYKWNMVAAFTFINTSINDFMSDAISPWILNTITDHKTKYLPYSKLTCLGITQLWSVYCNIMSVFGLFLAMTQVDFVLIRMSADLTVNMYTNLKFMRNKVTCSERYHCGNSGSMDELHELSVFTDEPGSSRASEETDRSIFCIEEDPAEAGQNKVKGAAPPPAPKKA